jgi:hypothetical protein
MADVIPLLGYFSIILQHIQNSRIPCCLSSKLGPIRNTLHNIAYLPAELCIVWAKIIAISIWFRRRKYRLYFILNVCRQNVRNLVHQKANGATVHEASSHGAAYCECERLTNGDHSGVANCMTICQLQRKSPVKKVDKKRKCKRGCYYQTA